MNENQNQSSVPHRAPDKQIPTRDHARTARFDSILGLHSFLGVVCLALLGLGFLLLETWWHWLPFLSIGAASCAGGAAASGLSAYYSGRSGVMRSLLFALPVLLVGVVARLGLSPSVGRPLNVWCAFGVLIFVASYAGGLLGAVYGKKRHSKGDRLAKESSSQLTTLLFMDENEPPPIPPVLNQITPIRGMSRKWKIVLAFFLVLILVLILALLALFFIVVVIPLP
jgi:hypothetical protein